MGEISEDRVQDLVAALKEGNAQAFELLFGHYSKRLYYFALGYLKSKADAEEIVQEVFYKVWKIRKTLKPELSFKGYIFKISYRMINDLFLKVTREQLYKHEIIATSLDSDNNLEERIDYHSLLELVEKIVNELPPRQKEIFIKRRREDIPVKEIAVLLDIAPKTVENHLGEAIKTIKSYLLKEKIAGLLFFSMFIKI